jgi:ribosomal protein S18 acetylase RimI-like enzyme
MYRPAQLSDLNQLVTLENACFTMDKLSRQSFRHLLIKGQSVILIEENQELIRGCVVILFHAQRKQIGRIYSCACLPAYRRLNIGANLLKYAEQIAFEKSCQLMRAEIRQNNFPSLRLFEKSGYIQTGTLPNYYEDRMTAIRVEKRLRLI